MQGRPKNLNSKFRGKLLAKTNVTVVHCVNWHCELVVPSIIQDHLNKVFQTARSYRMMSPGTNVSFYQDFPAKSNVCG
jgi:hypothetical protein